MSFYVDPSPNYEFDPPFPGSPSPRTIIELGSGMGMVAAAIANALNAQKDLMVATDLPEVSITEADSIVWCSFLRALDLSSP